MPPQRVANGDEMRYHFCMQISVTIPDELVAQAKSRGVPVEAYVRDLLEEVIRAKKIVPQRSRQEIEAFFDAMAERSANLPALPTETFTRESFYPPAQPF